MCHAGQHENTAKLQAVQNFACKIVSRAQRYDHVTPILRQLKRLPVKKHLYYRDLFMAFKWVNCLVPEYLSDQFIKRSSISTRRTRDSQLLNIPLFRSVTGQTTFSYRIISLCNALPQNIKLSQSLAQFKTMMRKILLTNSNRTQPGQEPSNKINSLIIRYFTSCILIFRHVELLVFCFISCHSILSNISLKSPVGTWNKCLYIHI